MLKPAGFIVIFLCAVLTVYAAEKESEFAVRVERQGALVIVDSRVEIRATPEQTWAVLTDFEHMGRFISNLTVSRVVSAPSERSVLVEQKGALSYGPFSIAFDSIKLNELEPHKSVRSRLVSGSFQRFDSMTTLAAEGEMTKIVYHAEAIPDTWLPPLIGPLLIRSEARQKFNELRDEILRRNSVAAEK